VVVALAVRSALTEPSNPVNYHSSGTQQFGLVERDVAHRTTTVLIGGSGRIRSGGVRYSTAPLEPSSSCINALSARAIPPFLAPLKMAAAAQLCYRRRSASEARAPPRLRRPLQSIAWYTSNELTECAILWENRRACYVSFPQSTGAATTPEVSIQHRLIATTR